MSAAERAARARQAVALPARSVAAPVPPAGMSISAPSDDEAVKTDTPPQDTHANLARLVTQLRDERDALASELSDLRARFRVMAREMHLLGAQWDKQPTKEV
jgi:hypothetical protein